GGVDAEPAGNARDDGSPVELAMNIERAVSSCRIEEDLAANPFGFEWRTYLVFAAILEQLAQTEHDHAVAHRSGHRGRTSVDLVARLADAMPSGVDERLGDGPEALLCCAIQIGRHDCDALAADTDEVTCKQRAPAVGCWCAPRRFPRRRARRGSRA